jgi:hypothetical protein
MNRKVYHYDTCHKCGDKKEKTTQSVCPSCRTKANAHKKKVKYITNKDLYIELIVSKAQGKLTRDAERMFIILGKHVIKTFYYKNEDDKFDCLQNGYEDLFKNWYSFDELKGTNAFAYTTEVFKRGAAKGFNKLHRLKGDKENKIQVISLTGYSHDGESFERF